MRNNRRDDRAWLLGGAAALAMLAGQAMAAEANFSIQPQALATALGEFSVQSRQSVLFTTELAQAKATQGVSGSIDTAEALDRLLAGTGLAWRREGQTFLIVQQEGGASPQGESAGDVDALIVTAQKREENIQDVPIAISAFTQKTLDEQKIEGGFDLLKAIPNVTFSKNNFSGFNFSIRGVGTKAISATTDQGVAVSFNNTTLIHNRLFEQEYFDVERVEVLRGPQGTLYGRNATSGVINVITAKPNFSEFDGMIKGEAGNYHTKRLSGFVNVPLIEDVLAVRFAGSMTDRQGYDYNTTTGNAVNGRDLWSGRLSIGFEPTESIRANLIWERFREDDNRSRTGKQLCTKDPGRTKFGAFDVNNVTTGILGVVDIPGMKSYFQQGCLPGSLYDDAAFGVVSGYGLSFTQAGLTLRTGGAGLGQLSEPAYGLNAGELVTIMIPKDPYAGVTQSRNLREIASVRDPIYRANADVLQLNMEFDVTPSLTMISQTAYNKDEVYSVQDYARYNSAPAFIDTRLLRPENNGAPNGWRNLAPGGVFCDPQFGCSDRIAIFDISQAKSQQFSQELRLQSSFDGPLNFSAGANYTRFKTLNDYYVLSNILTALSYSIPFYNANNLPLDRAICPESLFLFGGPVPVEDPTAGCPYVDPNPLESINGEGHNYFRSKNPYKLKSWAAFGEVYWNINDTLKLTAGLRYTDDEKTFIPVPSQTLLAPGLLGGGTVPKGYPEKPAIVQNWGEYTGRIGLDWKPELSLTDETLLYAFYSRGYKGGGANPPTPGYATKDEQIAMARAAGVPDFAIDVFWPLFGYLPSLQLFAVEYGPTFEPEFVDAFEVGAKNTLLGGAMTLNATGFYYDYKDYQVSQIRDRTAVNENFDAKIWGLEFESVISPTPNLRINASLGYLDTKIADGESSIDIMNRTQGNLDYAVVKPWVQLPSNCVLPASVIANWNTGGTFPYMLCPGVRSPAGLTSAPLIDPATNAQFTYDNYPELNGGAGIRDDLGGNELPNAPHWTVSLGAQYSWALFGGTWEATVRGDAYWQSQSWARVYNSDPYDKLHGWYNTNLSVWIEKPDADLKIEFYVKNLLDATPITDAFLNSDDTGLTTNIFTLDPRVMGLSIRKGF